MMHFDRINIDYAHMGGIVDDGGYGENAHRSSSSINVKRVIRILLEEGDSTVNPAIGIY
jgi:hypothetical protein